MLDIKDKEGNVVAVLLDNGTVIKKEHLSDDLEKIVREMIKNNTLDKKEIQEK